jgi:hypothetical protein
MELVLPIVLLILNLYSIHACQPDPGWLAPWCRKQQVNIRISRQGGHLCSKPFFSVLPTLTAILTC